MNTRLLAVVLGVLLTAPAFAADSYTIDPSHTHPSYEISHMGFSVQRGRFDSVHGKLTLDRAAKTGTADVTIDVASISTGVPKLDEHLKSEDFFNVAKFPTLTFKASRMGFQGDKVVSIPGELTLLGVTKPVTLAVERFVCGPHPMLKREDCGAEATATIRRTDFGMTKYVPLVGDEVKLIINVEALHD